MSSLDNINKIQGLIAGDGELPVKVAKSACKKGHEVIAISLSNTNRRELEEYCKKVYCYGPGELQKIVNKLHENNVKQLTFIGKVSKGILFRNPKLDKRAISLMKAQKQLNDDKLMLALITELDKENIETLDQTLFIKELMIKKGLLGNIEPSDQQKEDINFGFKIAKEMGRIDIGQTVVVQDKMALAIEAIEGTDKAIKRGGKLGNGKATVVKVSKPDQDQRFDIPTVGLNTIKTMKRYGCRVLAVEAGETFILQEKDMLNFANRNDIVVIAI